MCVFKKHNFQQGSQYQRLSKWQQNVLFARVGFLFVLLLILQQCYFFVMNYKFTAFKLNFGLNMLLCTGLWAKSPFVIFYLWEIEFRVIYKFLECNSLVTLGGFLSMFLRLAYTASNISVGLCTCVWRCMNFPKCCFVLKVCANFETMAFGGLPRVLRLSSCEPVAFKHRDFMFLRENGCPFGL
jgi:hypothetical protein